MLPPPLWPSAIVRKEDDPFGPRTWVARARERRLRAARASLAIAAVVAALLAPGQAARAQGEGSPETERAAAPTRDEPPRIEPRSVLAAVDPEREMSPDEARALQAAVREAREDTGDALLRERIACYRRFFVTACLADLGRRERLVRARLDRLEVAANRTLREHSALELNVRTAEDLERRQAAEPDDSARRDENRRAYESRQAAAELEQVRREAQAPDLARQAEANRSERARREAAAAARRLEREAADAREQVRRESRKADRERREAEARKRDESPGAARPGRPGRLPQEAPAPKVPGGMGAAPAPPAPR
jgi:hypothetical protein